MIFVKLVVYDTVNYFLRINVIVFIYNIYDIFLND